MQRNDSRTGKTSALMEKAVSLLATMDPGERVFVTGAHTMWLKELEKLFKSSGLVDVVFYTPSQIRQGALIGRVGVLLIDDYEDLKLIDRDFLNEAQFILARDRRG